MGDWNTSQDNKIKACKRFEEFKWPNDCCWEKQREITNSIA